MATSLSWTQTPPETDTAAYAVVEDCIKESRGCTYYAVLPAPQWLDAQQCADDYASTAVYDDDCPCRLWLYSSRSELLGSLDFTVERWADAA